MLHQDKVRLMTRLTMFEESREGKRAMRVSRFYKNDYVTWELIKTILSVTVGYVLVLAMAVLYHLEFLLAHAVTLDYKNIGIKILGGYLVLLVVYVSGGLIGYSYKYGEERKNLVRYYKSLKRLLALGQGEDIQEDNEEQEENLQ